MFPDWIGAVLNGTGAIDWWIHEFELWYKKIKVRSSGDQLTMSWESLKRLTLQYDGIWIDMSEVSQPHTLSST